MDLDTLLSGNAPLMGIDFSKLNTVLEEIVRRLKESEKQAAATAAQLQESRERVELLEADAKEQKNMMQQLAAMNSVLERDLKDKTQQISSLQQVTDKHTTEIEQLQKRAGLQSQTSQDKEMEKQLGAQAQQLSGVTDELKRLKERIEKVSANTDKVDHRVSDVEGSIRSDIAAMRAAHDSLRERVEKLEGITVRLEKDVAATNTTLKGKADREDAARNAEDIARLRTLLQRFLDDKLKDRLVALEGVQHQMVQDFKNAEENRKASERELALLAERLANLERLLNDLRNARFATMEYADQHYEDLLGRIEALATSLRKKLAGELRIFERDLQDYLEDQLSHMGSVGGGGGGSGNKSAIGRTHFRCLTCSSVVPAVSGPMTDNLLAETFPEAHGKSHTVRVADFTIEAGKEVPLLGAQGQIYKGRLENKMISGPDSRPTSAGGQRQITGPMQRSVQARPRTQQSRSSRPASAGPGRPSSAPRTRHVSHHTSASYNSSRMLKIGE